VPGLCQVAALHHVDKRNGVKDFDVWSFYVQYDVWPFPARWRVGARFRSSRFGRYPGDPPLYLGRRVDLLGVDASRWPRAPTRPTSFGATSPPGGLSRRRPCSASLPWWSPGLARWSTQSPAATPAACSRMALPRRPLRLLRDLSARPSRGRREPRCLLDPPLDPGPATGPYSAGLASGSARSRS